MMSDKVNDSSKLKMRELVSDPFSISDTCPRIVVLWQAGGRYRHFYFRNSCCRRQETVKEGSRARGQGKNKELSINIQMKSNRLKVPFFLDAVE